MSILVCLWGDGECSPLIQSYKAIKAPSIRQREFKLKMLFKSALLLTAAGSALAQSRPSNVSICDYYTSALLDTNNATNQYTLLTLLVNTAVIGNYTQPNVGVSVPGILNPNATYEGESVNLVPYFDGSLASSNTGMMMGKAVNFLDGGGAAPLMENMPANDESSKQQYVLREDRVTLLISTL